MDLARRLNIDFVGTLPPHNGGSAVLHQLLLTGLARRGHLVRAIAPITPQALDGGDLFARSHPEIEMMRIEVPYFHSAPDLTATKAYMKQQQEGIRAALSTLLATGTPDVILIGRETFVDDVLALVEREIPSAVLIHGGVVWGIVRRSLPDDVIRRVLDSYDKVHLCITVARHVADSLGRFGVECTVIENSIDTDAFRPMTQSGTLLRSHDIGEDRTVAAHISNFKPLKRPLDIIHSAQQALRGNPDLIYLMIGDGMMREETERACVESGVAEHFRFTGWVDYAQMPDYINLADIVIIPSEAEARALAYLETQACGRTLIASDIPAAREAVTDGETGLLFETGSIEALTEKTLLAAGNPTLREEIGRRARAQAQGQPIDRLVGSYEQALLKLAGR
ncbi:MAG: glycosyltransferase family 4 protein [Arenicellales bacterium]